MEREVDADIARIKGAEIVVAIFKPANPTRVEGIFDAGADVPAEQVGRTADRREARREQQDSGGDCHTALAPGGAPDRVEQGAVIGDPETTIERRKPILLDPRRDVESRVIKTSPAGIALEVAFHAEHKIRARLIIVAGVSAAHHTRGVQPPRRPAGRGGRDRGRGEGAAEVAADVKSGPGEGRWNPDGNR